jgi:hypothetical protein
MKGMDVAECERWCRTNGVAFDQRRHVRFATEEGHLAEIPLPRIALKVIALSQVLTDYPNSGCHPRTLVWLTESGMWSESFEAIGRRFWHKLMAGYGLPVSSMESQPGTVFDGPEHEDQKVFLTLIMLFQWDAILVPERAPYMVQLSHDGYIRLLSRGDQPTAEITAIYSHWRSAEA